jgi:lysozyme
MVMGAQQFRISDRGIALIQEFEGDEEGKLDGDRWQAYLDTIPKPPVPTIYFGLTEGVHMGMIITREQGDEMMKRELIKCETALERMVDVRLTQPQIDSLVSFVYNVGPGSASDTKRKKGFYWSTMRKLINLGKFAAAAGQFERYNRSGGRVVNGLTRRRKREAAMFMEPGVCLVPADDPKETMPPVVDVPTPASTVTQAIAQSPTIGAAGVGIAASTVQAGSSLWSWITDAGQHISAAKEASGPFSELFGAMHINVTSVTLAITIGALAFVAVRHFVKKREGLA